jgi:hypothetical protein
VPISNNALPPLTKVYSFVQGLLCGAKKLKHVAYLRRDPMLPALPGIKRVPSQSTFTRFFQGFTSAGKNLACFRPLFAWAMRKLPSKREGYALDLDSTRLLHEDGHQDGVAVGYTRLGAEPCLHPLLAIFSEVRLVAGFWLRAGNSGCANNVEAFFLDLWAKLPSHLRVRVVDHLAGVRSLQAQQQIFATSLPSNPVRLVHPTVLSLGAKSRSYGLNCGLVASSSPVKYTNATSRVEPHISSDGRRLEQKAGRSGFPNKAQRRSGRSCTHRSPAFLPPGMPGIGEVMLGAMQQAPQSGRQSMR